MSNKIEKIVRYYVKKALTEVVKELDVLIESKVQKHIDLLESMKKSQPSLNEVFISPKKILKEEQPKKRFSPEMLGIQDNTWKDVYNDILVSDNPILHETSLEGDSVIASVTNPEHISESVLQQSGLLQDYSRFLPKKKKINESDLSLEEKRIEILNKIKASGG